MVGAKEKSEYLAFAREILYITNTQVMVMLSKQKGGNMPKKHGFTIVELLVVISVIGILLTIGIVSYAGYQTRAKKTSAESTAQQVKVKLGEYYADKNSFPASKADVVSYLNTIGSSDLATAFNTVKNGASMAYEPLSDTNGNCTTGSPPPACAKYTITITPAYWGGATTDSSIVVAK